MEYMGKTCPNEEEGHPVTLAITGAMEQEK